MNIPLVSICCVTYNHASYMRQCLDGFVMQKTNFDFEILIHDDASTDETANIIREYESKYPHIIKPIYQVENQYSKGISPTYKFNLPRSQGKYIAFCEGDDYWTDPLKLQKQVDFLENNPEHSMCFHNVDVIADSCNLPTDIYSHLENRDYNIKELLLRWSVPTCSILMRGYIKETVPVNEKFSVGDNVLITTCSLYGKIKCINEFMGCYRRNAGGWTNMNHKGLHEKFIKHYDGMIESFPKKYSPIFKRIQADSFYYLAAIYIREKNYKSIYVLFNAAIKLHIYFISAVFRNLSLKIFKKCVRST